MITQKQDMADIFSVLHDGMIEDHKIEDDNLILKIYCQYLAKNINSSYEYFWIELQNINSISLMPWLKDTKEEVFWKDIELIFQKGLEILNTKITSEDTIQVICDCYDRFNEDAIYVGGILEFDCNSIRIFDEAKNEINLGFLKEIATKYWDKFSE
ncbi:hypothetical protein Fleli_0926 [Bernardetia litoralis DSM 6794]|uniref:Uncharacterized protein n=1 Tax=Bernardetia litoralis (strain ATCC 23117 / DSM 6794 / NBRC 15988 / NCIMB 1366 / Fx l1 / Sio-4) TaxID=880071 RepID=I4AHE5_BERLS|nr:hypothetical protein [Bernardetia litoralis]AFM03380.1 hypothetical protein Fleli_0926 [Bernardetia litoralis DSM 6794]